MLPDDPRLYQVDQQQRFRQLSADVQRIHRKRSKEYSGLMDRRIVGVFYHTFTLARARTRGLAALSHGFFTSILDYFVSRVAREKPLQT